MGTDKSEIVKIITAIKAQCPKAIPYKTKEEFNIILDMWYTAFKNYPKVIVWTATTNALKKTVFQEQNWFGAVNLEIEALKETNEKNDGELWTELTGVLNRVGKLMYFGNRKHWYNGEYIDPMDEVGKIYKTLNPILREYVGDISGLVALAQTETLEYEKGRFLKAVETLKKREKQKQEMSPDLAKLMQGVAGQIGVENQKLLK